MRVKCGLIIVLLFAACNINSLSAEEHLIKPKETKAKVITICEGIDKVLKDNRLIKVALPDNEMAYQDSLISRSALLPSINLILTKTYNKNQPAFIFGSTTANTADKEPFAFSFDIYQTLFDFGKSLSYYKASKEMLEATKANTQTVRRVATLEFVVTYFNLLEAEKMIAVFEKEVESITAYLDDIQHLYEQGVAVKNDLLPAKVKLADAKQKLITGHNAKEIAIAKLNNILSLPLLTDITVQDIQMDPPNLPEMEDAWKSAQETRPEITFYEDRIKSSFFAQRAKAVENFPELFVDGGYSMSQNRYMVHDDNLSLELGAKMNLYEGGAVRAGLLKERSYGQKLKEQKDKLIEDIKLEIEDSYYILKNSCEKVLVSRDALEQADENVRFYRVKYTAGSATSTDVLEAITMQTRAQTNYYIADYELKRSYAKLMYSMGIDLRLIYDRMESEKNGTASQ